MLNQLARWPQRRWPWALLSLSALGLSLTALYFQYAMGLEPCIKCIYQRTAVYGILLAGLFGWAFGYKHQLLRVFALLLWGYAAAQGLVTALEHVEIQNASNPFFITCEFAPNFPGFAPLHEWLPGIFGATGSCGDIDWQFLNLSMPEWMVIIFSLYSLALVMVVVARILNMRRL